MSEGDKYVGKTVREIEADCIKEACEDVLKELDKITSDEYDLSWKGILLGVVILAVLATVILIVIGQM